MPELSSDGQVSVQCFVTQRFGWPLVVIEWVDSHYQHGWHSDEPATEPLTCRSVGWLVHDGDNAKVIAAHVTDESEPQRCAEMTIPTAATISMQKCNV